MSTPGSRSASRSSSPRTSSPVSCCSPTPSRSCCVVGEALPVQLTLLQHPPEHPCRLLRLVVAQSEGAGAEVVPAPLRPFAHAQAEHGALLQPAQRHPQRALQGLCLFGCERVRRPRSEEHTSEL